MDKFSVIDLFAGAGGLSCGFLQTNKYEIKVAFENNKNMQATYRKNHKTVKIYGDICDADFELLTKEYGEFDVVIGGPPCQGFSNANRQKRSIINKNNKLVKEYIKAILKIKPKAFIMENVAMFSSPVNKFFLEKGDTDIEEYNIPTNPESLLLLENKYLFDDAIDLIKDIQTIDKLLWDEDCYLKLNIIYKSTKNPERLREKLTRHKASLLKYAENYINNNSDSYVDNLSKKVFLALKSYFNGNNNENDIINNLNHAIMIQRMLNKAKELLNNNIEAEYSYNEKNDIIVNLISFSVYDYTFCILSSDKNGYLIAKDTLNAADFGAPQIRNLFIIMGVKKGIASEIKLPEGEFNESNYRTVEDAIKDIIELTPTTNVEEDKGIQLKKCNCLSDLAKDLRDSDILYNHINTDTRATALERFSRLKQGENFHALDTSLKENTYSNIERTQNTIYLRLKNDKPCGTVVNIRKSMWIHPVKDRALSIREAARLQTFKDSYIFCGTKDQQYQQIGNAVPPILAKALATKLADILGKTNN